MKTIEEQIIRLNPGDIETFSPGYPGIYSGLPNEKYHDDDDSESSTAIKVLLISIKHRQDMENKSTDAMAFGTLFHDSMEVLRTKQDLSEFSRVIDGYKKNAKEPIAQFILKYYPLVHRSEYHQTIEEMTNKSTSKQSLLEIAEELEEIFLDGRDKVTTDDYDRSQAMVEAIEGYPVTKRLINYHGNAELSFYYEVEIDVDGSKIPVRVRVRPDDLIEFEDEIWIVDWKSIGEDATDRNIKNASWRWRYDIQAAMYHDIVSKFTDKPVRFRLAFDESVKPAKEKVRVIRLPEYDLEKGWEDYRKGIENKAKWIKDNSIWTGFPIPDDGVDTVPMRTQQY